MIDKISEALNQFCEQNGRGPRDLEIVPGQFGGYYVTLVWDGFRSMGLAERISVLAEFLTKVLGPVMSQVRSLDAVTFNERTEQEAVEAAIPSDPPWLRAN
ncbi:MAG TPA: hypothetical protein VKX17_02130 [Planctomycetota bacterium]|nr:hypothetical protein [Planctomycetota bacterium]